MKSIKTTQVPVADETHTITLSGYITGYIASIALTVLAYYFVSRQVSDSPMMLSDMTVVILLGVLAFIQFFVQAIYFLHLKIERKPKWKLAVFVFMIAIVFIVVVGSLWIMYNLNYNMMTPTETKEYMQTHEGF